MSEAMQHTDGGESPRRGLPVWKRAILGVSAVSVVFGLALGHLESSEPAIESGQGRDEQVARVSRDAAVPDGAPAPVPRTESAPAVALAPDSDSASGASAFDPAGASIPLAVNGQPVDPFGTETSGTTGSTEAIRAFQSLDTGPDAFVPRSSSGSTQVSPDEVRIARTEASEPDPAGPAGSPASTPAGTSPGTSAGTALAAGPSGSSPISWSPLFVKGGLSVFIGFCVGHALRAFFKLAAVLCGTAFLGVFALQYYGLVDLDWRAASDLYDQLAARVGGELGSLGTFVRGTVPSAGLASFGLFAGFKRGA